MKEKEDLLQNEYKTKKSINVKDISNIIWAMVNRQRFKYTSLQILLYLLTCICLRRPSKNRRRSSIKPHFLLGKAEEKFMHELDAIRIVKTLRKFKLLAQAMLT